MTVVCINQGAYIPWMGFFDRIKKSDIYICLDHVSIGADAMANRNKIRTPVGFQWLTIPIKNRGDDTPLNQIKIADDKKWRRQHLQAIKMNYARAPFYKEHIDFFEDMYGIKDDYLSTYYSMSMGYMLAWWDIETTVLYSSKLMGRGTKTDLNLNLCKEVGATKYISGAMGRDYLEVDKFEKAGIEVEFQDYKSPVYKQVWDGDFIPNLSSIDALFCCGVLPV